MINTFEAYLITRGDTLHSMLSTVSVVFIVLSVIAFIAFIVYIRVFDDNANADEEDTKSAYASVKIGLATLLILIVVQGIKVITPRSEDMLIIAGLREITSEDLRNTAPMTNEVLKKRFPDIAQGLTVNELKIKSLNAEITYKAKIIDSLSYELNVYRSDSNIIRLR